MRFGFFLGGLEFNILCGFDFLVVWMFLRWEIGPNAEDFI